MPLYKARRGRAEIPEFFAVLANDVTLYKFEPNNFLAGGDQVAVVVKYGIEIKGRRCEGHEMHLWTFNDAGLIARFAHVVDRHEMVAAWRGVDA